MTGWTLEYYRTAAGRCPVQEYLDSLEDYEAARVTYNLDLLQEYGVTLGAPHVRAIKGKLWELRTVGRIQHRVMYFAASGRRLILLHAFTKKTQKTPVSEIETAVRRKADYESRVEK